MSRKSQNKYVLDFGEHGKCNICGEEKKLSDEHIPPKKSLEQLDLMVTKAFKGFNKYGPEEDIGFNTFDGIIYRTICIQCNNLLGRHDQALIEFVNNARARLRILSFKVFAKIPPGFQTIDIRPISVARSILGKIKAARTRSDCDFLGSVTTEVLFGEKPIPENIRVFSWYHPFRSVKIRPLFTKCLGPQKAATFGVIKIPPLAFMVTDDCDRFHNLEDICTLQARNKRPKVGHRMKLFSIHDIDWPELSDGRITAMGADILSWSDGKPIYSHLGYG